MQTAIDSFEVSLRRVQDMHALHQSLEGMLTSAIDLTDILRAELVLAVSAFDHFVHEVARVGMLECHQNSRSRTAAFERFPVPMASAGGLDVSSLDALIRERHGYLSFQHPDKVADAIRLISGVRLWEAVGNELGMASGELKADLKLVIDRRNQIAHEADVNPTYPGQRWPIDRNQVEVSINLLEKVARAILKVVK